MADHGRRGSAIALHPESVGERCLRSISAGVAVFRKQKLREISESRKVTTDLRERGREQVAVQVRSHVCSRLVTNDAFQILITIPSVKRVVGRGAGGKTF